MQPLIAPKYKPGGNHSTVMMAVESMRRHMSDEGWQIAQALQFNGYQLTGYNLKTPYTDTKDVLDRLSPGTLVVQDKREWDPRPGNFRDQNARFTNVEALKDRDDIFKLTILKDAQNCNAYHSQSADEMGVHCWIVYYDKDRVCSVAPFVRREHLIRTYHSIDKDLVPRFESFRKGSVLSGAVSQAYPLRQRLVRDHSSLPSCDYLKHPGYHSNGTCTPGFMKMLNEYRVAICTASKYQYLLRKIIEATACGCVVLTDLQETVPHIDENLVRIDNPNCMKSISRQLEHLYSTYDDSRQRYFASLAKEHYDYRVVGAKLASAIENARRKYHDT